MFAVILGVVYTVLVGGLAYFVYSVKALSTMLDRKDKLEENEEFLRDFGFRMKVNRYFEKVWPTLKLTKLESVTHSVYKVSVFGFVAILVLCYAFPSIVKLMGPVLIVALGIFSVIGNALRPHKRVNKIGKIILIPFCVLFPLIFVYQIDVLPQGEKIRLMLSQLSMSYSMALLGFSLVCSIISFVLIKLVERFERVIVLTLLDRSLLLAQRLVLVGVITQVPKEIEMRAIAKDAITATVGFLSFLGVVVGALVTLVKLFL